MTALAAQPSLERTRAWLPHALRTYTWIVAGCTLVLSIGLWLAGLGAGAQTVIMLALVAIIGLPHGAYDMAVGRELWSARAPRTWWLWFGGSYLVLAALALGLWMVAPWVGLLALLVGGAAHWGADDLENPPAEAGARLLLALSRGAVPVALPLLFHPAAVADIFAVLVGGDSVSASATRSAGLIAAAFAAPGLIWSIVRARSARARAAVEVLVLIALFAAVEPLLAFAIYFCLWHSVRHSMESASRIHRTDMRRALGRYMSRVIVPTLLTWVLAIPAWLVLSQEATAESGVWRLVFIGLFALTVPHVLLEWLDSNRDRSIASS